jgi:hypothetical protein
MSIRREGVISMKPYVSREVKRKSINLEKIKSSRLLLPTASVQFTKTK